MMEEKPMKLLQPVTDYSSLNQAMLGPLRGAVILAGIKLGLFDHLSEGKSAEAVSGLIESDTGKSALLLDALTAEKLLTKKNAVYRNTEISQSFLVKKSPFYLGEMFLSLAALRYISSDEIISALRKPGSGDKNEKNLSKEKLWIKAASYLKNYQRAGIAQQVVDIVTSLPEFPGFEKILDMGGGPGLMGIGLVLAHKTATGVIFDLPGVTEAAMASVREYGLEHRITVTGGDYNADSFGSGYDFVFSSLSLYYAGDLGVLCEKIHEALNPGGIFMSYHEGLFNERTEPEDHIIARIGVALRGQDLSFNRGEIAGKMLKAGFCHVRSGTVYTSNGPIDIDIARKKK